MTAMSQARSVVESKAEFTSGPVKAATTIFQGALVVNDGGVLGPGRTALNLVAIGVAEQTVVNPGAAGEKRITPRRGTFKFANLGADAITEADLGKDAYIVDDQTVAKTSGANTRSVAGKIIQVDSDGVFVRVGF